MFYEAKIDCDAFDVSEHLEGFLKRDRGEEVMGRFACKRSAITAIGKAIGEAANDPDKREEFRKDPVNYLKAAGIPEESLKGVNLKVHEDDDDTIHFVLPSAVDAGRLRAQDHEYLKLLGMGVVGACMRPLR